MKKSLLTVSAFISFTLWTTAQVEVNKPIQLTGSGGDARISGIEEVSDAQDAVSAEAVQLSAVTYAAASNSGNAYAVTLAPAPAAYAVGMIVHFLVSADNTGAATLNVNGLGNRDIRKHYNVALASGDLKSGQLVSVMYDGALFQLLSPVAAAPAAGLTAENSSSATVWQSANTSNAWEDITSHTHTVGQSGRYLVVATFESIDGSGGTNQHIRISANGTVSSRAVVGPNVGSWQYFTLSHMVSLTAGQVVKLQKQNDWNYCCKNQVRNIQFSLIKVQ
jgi:hypothetical protein